jgi:hypothetical protein
MNRPAVPWSASPANDRSEGHYSPEAARSRRPTSMPTMCPRASHIRARLRSTVDRTGPSCAITSPRIPWPHPEEICNGLFSASPVLIGGSIAATACGQAGVPFIECYREAAHGERLGETYLVLRSFIRRAPRFVLAGSHAELSCRNDDHFRTGLAFLEMVHRVNKRSRLTPPSLGRSIAWLADRRRDPTPINRGAPPHRHADRRTARLPSGSAPGRSWRRCRLGMPAPWEGWPPIGEKEFPGEDVIHGRGQRRCAVDARLSFKAFAHS